MLVPKTLESHDNGKTRSNGEDPFDEFLAENRKDVSTDAFTVRVEIGCRDRCHADVDRPWPLK